MTPAPRPKLAAVPSALRAVVRRALDFPGAALGILRDARAAYLEEDRLLVRLVLVFLISQLASIGWDLPCMYGWENDGVAPRDWFGGLANNLMPGQAHRYPLLHNALLALICWPVVLVAALSADSLAARPVLEAVLSDASLTSIALLAKLLSVAMNGVALLALARIVRRTWSPSAGRWAAAFAAVNVSFAYYGRVTNLDGPYLMWTLLAADRLLDVFERGSAGSYHALGFCVAASIATKDQAYASYVLALPLYLVVWPALRPHLLPAGRRHWARLGWALGGALLWLAALGGSLWNPTGAVARWTLLTGTNSQDWRVYPRTLAGMSANLRELWAGQAEYFWPWPVVGLAWLGVLIAARPLGCDARRADRSFHALARPALRLLPLALGISSLCCFTLVVGRSGHRFALPLGCFLACYAGGIASLALAARWPRRIAASVLTILLLLGAHQSLSLHLTQWSDSRRQVRAWLARLPPASQVETYGLGVYLPVFDRSARSPYRVSRVGPDDPARRPVIPGLHEVRAAYGQVQSRGPDVLVVSEGFATRFLEQPLAAGRASSVHDSAAQRDTDAVEFFRRAWAGALPGYRLTLAAATELPGWARALGLRVARVHGSTGTRTYVFERAGGAGAARAQGSSGRSIPTRR